MTRPRRPHPALATLLACGVLLLGVMTPASAAPSDDRAGAPVTRDDRVVIRGGATAYVDVVANDTDPDGDEIDVCRVDIPDGVPLVSGNGIVIVIRSDADDRRPLDLTSVSYRPGTYRITYYACDRAYLTPGTLTVVVTRTRPVRARKVAPRVVRFANPDDRAVQVQVIEVGSREGDPDPQHVRTVVLRPGAATRVRVLSRTEVLIWIAMSRRGDSVGSGDFLFRRR